MHTNSRSSPLMHCALYPSRGRSSSILPIYIHLPVFFVFIYQSVMYYVYHLTAARLNMFLTTNYTNKMQYIKMYAVTTLCAFVIVAGANAQRFSLLFNKKKMFTCLACTSSFCSLFTFISFAFHRSTCFNFQNETLL